MQAKAGRVRDPPNPVRPAFRFASIALSSHLEFITDPFRQRIHIPAYLVIGDFGINLCCGDAFMSQHLADCFQRYALRERNRCGKGVPRHVHCRIE